MRGYRETLDPWQWFVAILIIAAIMAHVLGPIVCIWAVNTLFGWGIELTLQTWAAVFILQLFFGSRSVSVNRKKE
jgi:hypothetical protein